MKTEVSGNSAKNYAPRDLLHRPLTRRELMASAAVLVGAPVAASVYGFGVEPRWMFVEDVRLALPDFPGEAVAVQISDVHFKGRMRFLKKIAEAIGELDADYLFITGDLAENEEKLAPCLKWLSGLRCKAGAFCCPGNWEHWSGNLKRDLDVKLAGAGIRMLNNEGVLLDRPGGSFYLAGIDAAFNGKPNQAKAMANQPDGACTIVLSHEPCIANELDDFRTDLILSGHTHGGQVRLPIIGAPITPPGSAGFVAGMYEVGEKKLYVNRGLGTSILPVRFGCPPEVTRFFLSGG